MCVSEASPYPLIEFFNSGGVTVGNWSNATFGYPPLLLSNPDGLAVGPVNGDIYLADGNNNIVYEIATTGVTVTSWTTYGTTGLLTPAGVAADSTGNIYVTEHGTNNVIDEFNSAGATITQWAGDGINAGIAISPVSGNIYVSSFVSGGIHEYTPSGTSVTQWVIPGGPVTCYDLTVAPDGNVYATGSNANKVYEFDPNGNLLAQWGSAGTGNGAFNTPIGILVTSAHDVYVADDANKLVQIFGP